MAKRKQNRVIFLRNSIIAFVSAIVILIIGFGSYVSTGLSDEDITDASFREVDNPKPYRPGDPVEVVEFFSYSCIHCKNFDPVLEEWAADKGDTVNFKRTPAMWSPIQAVLGRSYLTLEQEDALKGNHDRIFRAIHESRRQFLTPEMMADYVDGRGITRDEFLRTYKSPAINSAAANAQRDQERFRITATPMLVVGGRYVVSMEGGQRNALRIVDHLVDKMRAPETSDS